MSELAEKLDRQMDEAQRVITQRAITLQRSGFSGRQALRMAKIGHIDVHSAGDMVRSGCDPDLVERILT